MEKKICNKCNVEKELSAFVFDNSKKKYTPACKECRALLLKEKRASNREEYNNKTTEWRRDTIERQKENRLKWKHKDIEYTNSLNRKSYHKKKEQEQFEYFMIQLEQQESEC